MFPSFYGFVTACCLAQSQNTFIMALDGDTDFYPGAVHILLDRMKKNPKVGAACGRIHPIGSGRPWKKYMWSMLTL